MTGQESTVDITSKPKGMNIGDYTTSFGTEAFTVKDGVVCPYCRGPLLQASGSRRVNGRVLAVLSEPKKGERQRVLTEPVPKGITVVMCKACRVAFASQSVKWTKRNGEASGVTE